MAAPQERIQKIQEKFGDNILETSVNLGEATVTIKRECVVDLMQFLHDDSDLSFDFLMDVDNADISLAHSSTSKAKKFFDDYKVPYWLQFSVAGDTPVMIKQNNKIQILNIKEAVKQYQKNKESRVKLLVRRQ